MIWWLLFSTLVFIFLIYAFIPEFIFHFMHRHTLFRGPLTERTLALTFDDGPDERYTPTVLDILKEMQVKATFFVVASEAQKSPHLVRRMVDEGHVVASHSWKHRHAWLRTPWGTYLDIARSKQIIESITQVPVRYYRPPWGAMNLFMYWTCTRLGLRLTLWSMRAIDWKPGEYVHEIIHRLVTQAHPGGIALCHDAGGALHSTDNMVGALPEVITQLRNLGFRFTTVDHMEASNQHQKLRPSVYQNYPFFRRLLISIWTVVEYAFEKQYHVHPLNSLFRVSLTQWHYGPRRPLPIRDSSDVTSPIHDGQIAIDLHFQNETLLSFSTTEDDRAALRLLRITKAELADVGRVMMHHPDYRQANLIASVTLMNRGIEMLGFHVEDLPDSAEKRRLERYMKFLMGLYHPEGFRRLQKGRKPPTLKLVWMTREELLARYPI
jgi:peptidoglycan-N-acetylglucosamine deacetylase